MERGFAGTDWSEDHIARHQITPEEVEEVLYTRPRFTVRGRDETRHVFGTTDSGRYLLVALADDRNGLTAFVVTAREMTSKEKTLFAKKAR